MNMKYFNKILAIGLLLCAGLSSCEMKDEIKGGKNGNSDFGYLELGVGVSAKTNQSSRAEAETVSADEFPVEINGVTASDYKKTFNTYAELKAQGKIELPVGSYIVKAHTPGDIKPQMDAPYYYGEASNLIITKDVTSEVTVTCTMKNTKISLKYTEKFLKSLTSWTITVTDGTSNILSYDNTNTTPSPKYWLIADKVSDIKVHIDGVNVQGSKVSEDRIITKPSGAASEYWGGNDDLTITMDINEEVVKPGVTGITVRVDVTFKETGDTVEIPVEPDNGGGTDPEPEPEGNAPTITSEYLANPITCLYDSSTESITGAPAAALVNIAAEAGIKSLMVKITAGNTGFAGALQPLGLDTGKDLLTLDSSNSMDGILIGVLNPLPKSGDKSYSLDIAKFIPMMGAYGSTTSDGHVFDITVTDANNKSAAATLKVVINNKE